MMHTVLQYTFIHLTNARCSNIYPRTQVYFMIPESLACSSAVTHWCNSPGLLRRVCLGAVDEVIYMPHGES